MLFGNREDLERYRKTREGLLFEWKVPDRAQLEESPDGSVYLKDGTTPSELRTQWINSHSAEWVNFARALATSDPHVMISSFGFLRLGQRDTRSDWEEIHRILDTALSAWNESQPKAALGKTLIVGDAETPIQKAKAVLRDEIEGAVADGTITVEVQDDMEVLVRPRDLRNFMLLDAAEAILTKPKYIDCLHCGNAFRPQDNRQRSYCSIRCRGSSNQMSYLARKKQESEPQPQQQSKNNLENPSNG